ncbi:S-layer homology domain-containing protein [Domibacillus indicus]|uniref:S-layer homology domain-containing protein n=1 Tax=Domibacillus indicus TaxID=1437523 RepID=UPI0037BE2EE4
MYKHLDLNAQSNVPETNFKDVPARAAQAVAALKYHGIVNGKSDVYFGAADNITRGEATSFPLKNNEFVPIEVTAK